MKERKTMAEAASESPIDLRENTAGKTFIVISGPPFVGAIAMLAVPAMPAMAERFAAGGDGAFFAQMIMTLPAIMIILSAVFTGALAEIFGRRRVLLSALVLYALAGAACLVAPDANTLIAARLVLGLAGGSVLTTAFALSGDYPPGGPRERIVGYAGAAAAGSAVVALIVGGVLVDAIGWRAPFALHLLSLVVFVVAWRSIKTHRHVVHEHGLLAPVRLSWPVYLLTIVLTLGLFMPGIQGPFLLLEEGVTSAAAQGLVLASYSLTAAVFSGAFGALSRRFSLRALIALAGVAMGSGMIVMASVHDVVPLAIGCVIIGIGAGLVEPITITLILARTPVVMHPRAVGLLLSAVFLGQFLNPWTVNPLRHTLGIHGAFLTVGTVYTLLGMLVILMGGVLLRRILPATTG